MFWVSLIMAIIEVVKLIASLFSKSNPEEAKLQKAELQKRIKRARADRDLEWLTYQKHRLQGHEPVMKANGKDYSNP